MLHRSPGRGSNFRKQMGGDESSFPAALESELALWTAKWLGGKLWSRDEQHQHTQGASLQSIRHLTNSSSWMQQPQKIPFLPAVVPSQLFISYQQSRQSCTQCIYPFPAVTRSVLGVPRSTLGTLSQADTIGASQPCPAQLSESTSTISTSAPRPGSSPGHCFLAVS